MTFRVTDATQNDRLVRQITTQRERLAVSQEQIASGKRINRPSDDPYGTAAVIDIRASQADLAQFGRNANVANDALTAADSSIDSYQNVLDHVKSLLTQGISGFTTDAQKVAIATELDGIRQGILTTANLQRDGQYLFGGTRQDVPPFDPTTEALAATPTTPRSIQIEPNSAPFDAGVTADAVFSGPGGTVFDMLKNISAALRGTGDPVADQATLTAAMQQLGDFTNQAAVARTALGKNMNQVQDATSRMSEASLSLEGSSQTIESVDFAKAATDLAEAQRALDAILQSGALTKGKTLLDFLS